MTKQVCKHADNARFIGLLVCALAASSFGGCTARSTPVSDVDQATALITRTFDEWKNGATLVAQREKSPPVYVAEELWLNGTKLSDYKLTEPGEVFGTNIRFRVTLNCADKSGATKSRDLKYLVTTTPACTIAREDR